MSDDPPVDRSTQDNNTHAPNDDAVNENDHDDDDKMQIVDDDGPSPPPPRYEDALNDHSSASPEGTQPVDYSHDAMAMEDERALALEEQRLQKELEDLQAMLEVRNKELRQVENKRKREEREVQKLLKHINNVEILKKKTPVPSFKIKHPRGVVGLQNLGNTCFMNSALQCLAKSPGIRDYFLTEQYKSDINTTNRLGTGGELVTEFAEFLKQTFKGEYADLSPRCMKFIVGKFCSQFEDYNQQDSAEFIQYVLDGLHEDLNRVIEKPLTDPVEANGRPDDEVAQEAWDVHLKRNDSIFVDKFQGQMRSTLVCPKCRHASSTFDPFFSLSLPVPIPTRFRKFTVVHVPLSKEKPMTVHGIVVNEATSVRGLRKKISETFDLPENDFVIADVAKDNAILQFFYNKQSQRDIHDHDRLYVYEFPDFTSHTDTGKQIHETYLRSEIQNGLLPFARVEVHAPNHKGALYSFAIPFLQDGQNKNRDMYKLCLRGLSRFQIGEVDENDIPFQLLLQIHGKGTEVMPQDDGLAIRVVSPPPFRYGKVLADCQLILLHLNENYSKIWNSEELDHKFDLITQDESFKVEMPLEKPKTLYECLDMFSTEEKLDIKCPKCGEQVESRKKTDVWRLPETLIIQLNRFQYQGYTRTKLSHPIDFPVYNLDMSEYTSNSKNLHKYYDLYAVSNHYGTLASGHYTSFAKTVDEKSGEEKWHKYDDMIVTEVDESDVEKEIVTSAGYVLFYQAKKEKTPPPQTFSQPKITISILSDDTFKMSVSDTTTFGELRNFIFERIGWESQKYRLIFATKDIDVSDDKTLKEFGIGAGSSVHLIQKTPNKNTATQQMYLENAEVLPLTHQQ